MSDYAAFLTRKTIRARAAGMAPDDVEALAVPAGLFPHQEHCIRFALRQGRAGIFIDTGLGKSAIELAFAERAAAETNDMALILTPLAVARQMATEAQRWGIEARVIREQAEAGRGVNICNYDRLERLDLDAFGAVALDEASILKNFAGKTSRALIEAFAHHRFRMAATATPAPNDHMELGQHAAFLGVMTGNEMLSRFFINDTSKASQEWRLKRHAETAFYDWMASWCRMAQSPADLGFDGSAFNLPPLRTIRHQAMGDAKPQAGSLFAFGASAATMFDLKRQTAAARADAVATLVADSPVDEPWVIWCDIDAEADAIMERIPEAIEVRGSHPIDRKEETIAAFGAGEATVLVTKSSICGHGLNWQHCARMAFVGRSFSYEAWYQAVRRCWRFGQKRPVEVHLIVAEGEDQIGRVIDRKAADHDRMRAAMAEAMRRAAGKTSATRVAYEPKHLARMPPWIG